MKKTVEQKKKDILHIAIQLFAEKGYEATTMAEIAKLAGVGFGTVATYFDNKEKLLLACVEEPMQPFLQQALAFDVAPNDCHAEIEQMAHHHMKLFSEQRLYLLLLMQVIAQREKYSAPFVLANKGATALSDRIEQLIAHGQQQKQLAPLAPNVIAVSYMSLLIGLFLSTTDDFSAAALRSYADNATRLFGLQ